MNIPKEDRYNKYGPIKNGNLERHLYSYYADYQILNMTGIPINIKDQLGNVTNLEPLISPNIKPCVEIRYRTYAGELAKRMNIGNTSIVHDIDMWTICVSKEEIANAPVYVKEIDILVYVPEHEGRAVHPVNYKPFDEAVAEAKKELFDSMNEQCCTLCAVDNVDPRLRIRELSHVYAYINGAMFIVKLNRNVSSGPSTVRWVNSAGVCETGLDITPLITTDTVDTVFSRINGSGWFIAAISKEKLEERINQAIEEDAQMVSIDQLKIMKRDCEAAHAKAIKDLTTTYDEERKELDRKYKLEIIKLQNTISELQLENSALEVKNNEYRAIVEAKENTIKHMSNMAAEQEKVQAEKAKARTEEAKAQQAEKKDTSEKVKMILAIIGSVLTLFGIVLGIRAKYGTSTGKGFRFA